jgi:hypothetical protein
MPARRRTPERLLDEHEKFSVLVERLLKDWLGRPPKKRLRR